MPIPEGFTEVRSSAVKAYKIGRIDKPFTIAVQWFEDPDSQKAKDRLEAFNKGDMDAYQDLTQLAAKHTCELQVIFTSGQRVHYEHIPLKLAEEFGKSDSKGRFMHNEIKPNRRFYYADPETGERLMQGIVRDEMHSGTL